ncbi:Protein PIN-LIKES 7, partial [Linum perenne]
SVLGACVYIYPQKQITVKYGAELNLSKKLCKSKKPREETEQQKKKKNRMGFWILLQVASMPVIQVLIIGVLGAFLATDYINVLHADARKYLNKVVFTVFTPSLMFAILSKTVTFEDIISWWFMPVNIGLTMVFGGALGWVVVKVLRPKPHLEGLLIATCAAGNYGNLLLIVVPAICKEDGTPFGDHASCGSIGLSYASFSAAVLGAIYIWTCAYQLVRTSAVKFKALQEEEDSAYVSKLPNPDLEGTTTHLLTGQDNSGTYLEDNKTGVVAVLHRILHELTAPPTLSTILGFLFGATPFLRNLIVGEAAPLRVVQDSITLLGDGTIPSITLILGGNLTQGLRSSTIKPLMIVGVVCVRYVFLPVIGICVIKAAASLGLLPSDPLFAYVLMLQYSIPPAMNIGTMTQLFDVAQEECSVIFLWTYLFAAIALTLWSTVYLWILS